MTNTKELIIEKTAALFARNGFAGTSISMITREVGLSKSAFYGHFQSKDEVMKTIVERYGPPSIIQYVRQFDQKKMISHPPRQFTDLMMGVVKQFSTQRNRVFIDLLRRGCISFNDSKSAYSLRSVIENTKNEGGKFIRKLQDFEIIKKDFQPAFLAWELLAPMIHVRLMLFNSDSNEADIKEGTSLCRKHIQYFIHNNFERQE